MSLKEFHEIQAWLHANPSVQVELNRKGNEVEFCLVSAEGEFITIGLELATHEIDLTLN